MRGPLEEGRAELEAHLDPASADPVVVALSGGGDSTALLLVALAWARAVGRRLVGVTVDHQLQAASADWSRQCSALCARLGVEHRALVWTGDKPATGVSAAARAARHRLIADAARVVGARVILMGHTADDILEAAAMRSEGSNVPNPAVWAPSPAWPEGRGLFLLRPLLWTRREALRDILREAGEAWIDDPANDDPLYARARARQSLSQWVDMPARRPPFRPDTLVFAEGAGASLISAGRPVGRVPLGQAAVCVGGGSRIPNGHAVSNLAAQLGGADRVTAGLAGARFQTDAKGLLVAREVGEFRRKGLAPQVLEPGMAMVWDGRYEITALAEGLSVSALAGHARRLPKAEQAALGRLPSAVRGALPAIFEGDRVSCPILAPGADVQVRPLVFERFKAAMGVICVEAAIPRVAERAGNY